MSEASRAWSRDQVVDDVRPWGRFRRYTQEDPATVKLITVHGGAELSLQRHAHRDELWVVLDPGLRVRVGDAEVDAAVGDEFFIPRGVVHRAGAQGKTARFLEIAFGSFDENDVHRLEDLYGRA